MTRDKALVVGPVMPSEGGNGLAMRAGMLLEGIARAFDVELLIAPVFGEPHAPGQMVRACTKEIRTLKLDPQSDLRVEMMRSLATPSGRARAQRLHPLPALCHAATSHEASEAVARCASDAALVFVLRSYLAPLLDALLTHPQRPPILLDVDDIDSVTQRQLGDDAEAECFERLENYYLPLLDGVVTCSRVDADALVGRLGLAAVSVIPNAVALPARPRAPSGEIDLLFVANLSYAPNVEAALWLCHEVLPLLDDVSLAVVGSGPTPEVRALGTDPRVTVAADVEDVTSWYEAASVAVAPLLRGGGTRIKVIEALAHRRPVVATPAAAVGLPWSAAESPIVIAGSAARFASACRELLSDRVRANTLADAGRALVERAASVDVVGPEVERLARSMVSR